MTCPSAAVAASAPARLWAPRARRVDLVLRDDRLPMEPSGGGWWALRTPTSAARAGAGTDYAFSLDGGPPRPDPRSPFQPHGVHGPSRVVDHAAFSWTDSHWRGLALPGAVLYELCVGTFSAAGTFDGVVEHLPHLVDLGVTAVELMPVVEFPGRRGWGYDGVDLFAPHHAFGGPEGLKRLVDACHTHGLGVVIDVVYNHLGPSGNYLAEFGPYFSGRHQTGWGSAVNFDGPDSDEVRRFVIDNALMWLADYHADGLRLDAVHAIVDDSPVHILEELAAEVDALAVAERRPLFLVAESDRNDPRLVRSREAGGYGLAGVWSDDWHHALHALLTGERTGYYGDFGSLAALAKALRQAVVYDGVWSAFRHRAHGRSQEGVGAPRFVVCAQNHDQVGNRAAGERLGALTGPGRLRIAAALLLTCPFTPLLFAGEEWGASSPFQYFTDHDDPDLGQAVSEGRKRESAAFGQKPDDVPDPQDPATFGRSRLDWSEIASEPHAGLLDWYRTLLRLRRTEPALSDPRPGRTAVRADERAGRLLVERGGELRVGVNLGSAGWCLDVPSDTELLAASDDGITHECRTVVLPPDTVAIWRSGRDRLP